MASQPSSTPTDPPSKLTVEHIYHDFSQVTQPVPGGQERGGKTFPLRLHHMLSQVEMDGLSHIVSWQPHGRCFLVHRQDEFVNHILPM